MLSSALTNISVFLPLIFMSGIAGALFFDQAFSVTVGLLVSYLTGITFIPVLYKLIYSVHGARFTVHDRKKAKTESCTVHPERSDQHRAP
jgi:multidrug efflux pump subunit AcrB